MRKLLISVLIIVLFIMAGYMCINGMTIVNLDILGIKQIQAENKKLDDSISVASRLASTDYPTEISNVAKSLKELQKEKENYENLVTISTESDVQAAAKMKKFETEYLWTKIGNYAKKEGVTMKLDFRNSSTGTQGLYDLEFTVTGQYIGIADFIYEVENDDTLGFKIENFKLLPSQDDTNILVGTFNCKDIAINIDPSNISSPSLSTQTSGDNNAITNQIIEDTTNTIE